MSSHHIVRDQQEPALIVHDTAHIRRDVLDQLLEWSPTVLAMGESINWLMELGTKIDFCLLEKDKMPDADALAAQDPVQLFEFDNSLSIDSALAILMKEGHDHVNIITSESKVRDLLQSINLLKDEFQIILYVGSSRLIFFRGSKFSKWYARGTELYLESLGTNSPRLSGGVFRISGSSYVIEEDGEYSVEGTPPIIITEVIR